ncbi:MAG: response regulator [Candidatus Electrothrix aestuarii]|uniref:Response regulator n=1 Tax=Candidatus Electrothrix aestuarii TaxID=3062594 RepID=A0AAU8LTW0_9BACT|nr:MAG: response regulator [Candidatus Electrothrix sp. GW3-3]
MDFTDAPCTVLIVDDDPFGIIQLQTLLKDSGYKLITASDGASAIEIVKRDVPDIILLDIIMPNMDGYETCRHLKEDELSDSIPIIFLSGLNSTEEKINAFEAGGVDYITKPFSEKEVLVRLQTHLTLHRVNKHLVHELENRDEELQHQESKAQNTSTALRVLLSAIEEEKKELAERIQFKAEKLILPKILEIAAEGNPEKKEALLESIVYTFQELTRPFVPGGVELGKTLSPTELQIVNLIKQGKSSKEISDICNISVSTIASHRKTIRKKLNITNTKVNLYTYLNSLD